jgi:hypothetical protein
MLDFSVKNSSGWTNRTKEEIKLFHRLNVRVACFQMGKGLDEHRPNEW